MASYQQIEADERTDSREGLEFKSFLGNEDARQDTAATPGRGYLRDQATSFWSLEYYQPHFDVDTQLVLKRCYTTLLPTSSEYLTAHVTPSPDLYGPFWTLSTLAFSLFVFSSLASSITSYLSTESFNYDFKLLSIAVSLTYSYGLGFPILLWLALRYLHVEWSVIEAIAVFGYGHFVWIPVSVLCVIPIPILRWALVGVAFGLSGYFLVANIYPILSMAEAKATRLLVIIIVVLHAALAITFKVLFFSYYIVEPIGGDDPLGGSGPPIETGESSTEAMRA